MASFIFWDKTPRSLLNTKRSFWVTSLNIQPWRWRRYILSKHQSTLNGLHGVISEKMGFYITTAVTASNLTYAGLDLNFQTWNLRTFEAVITTAQKTHHVPNRKRDRLMLFRDIISINYKNHMKLIYTRIRRGSDKSLAFPIFSTTQILFLGWVKEVRTTKSQVCVELRGEYVEYMYIYIYYKSRSFSFPL
jgi:hypothetical protein